MLMKKLVSLLLLVAIFVVATKPQLILGCHNFGESCTPITDGCCGQALCVPVSWSFDFSCR
ncbi:hypothetical protein BVRB_1g001020 [Beta vulgaris subsp. vulgaris]|nr:hypothetical protein BVRB_1g001020 [Beta vulgaris subsp. vulgaris]